jgi:hypothetical protein
LRSTRANVRDIRDIRDTNILFPQRLFAAFEDEKVGERVCVLRKKCIFVKPEQQIGVPLTYLCTKTNKNEKR